MNTQAINASEKRKLVEHGQMDMFWYLLKGTSASKFGMNSCSYLPAANQALKVGDPVKYLSNEPAGVIKRIRGEYAVLEPFSMGAFRLSTKDLEYIKLEKLKYKLF